MPFSTIPDQEGGLWEMGVLFPIKNPLLERFENNFTLRYDVNINDNVIYIDSTENRLRPNSLIFIGPSTEPSRNTDGVTFLYYGKYEIFKIRQIIRSYPYTPDGQLADAIYLESWDGVASGTTVNSYLKNDPVVSRLMADSWDFMTIGDFSSLVTPSVVSNREFEYERGDALDDMKGYTQVISTEDALNTYDMGLIQKLDAYQRTFLNSIINKKARMTSWMKFSFEKGAGIVGDDIDENIGMETPGNDIDEGLGFVDTDSEWDGIDERDQADFSNTIAPYLRMSFYDDVAESSVTADEIETLGYISEATENIMMYQTFDIPNNTLSARVAAYAKFASSPNAIGVSFAIDDIIVEHCANTSKEDNGYYQVDMNPAINVAVGNRTSKTISRDAVGKGYNKATGDPNLRYKIDAEWRNRSGQFINDMYALEEWNNQGYPIVLRPKMPATFPNVILCNMKVSSPDYIKGYPGTERANVSIEFEEITA